MTKTQPTLAAALLGSLASCSPGAGGPVTYTGQAAAVRLECAAESGSEPRVDWQCPESVQVDCSDPDDNVLEVLSPSSEVCDVDVLTITHDDPLTPGTHVLEVRDAQDAVLCSSEAIVVRGAPLALRPKHLKLWPPNHKLHEISAADCVDIIGACPGERLTPRFIWASSDEAVDAKGSGRSGPDIAIDERCERLSLRAERQGPSNGRVYTLGVRLVDTAGDEHETTCTVSVDHDQSGRDARADDDAYHVDFDGSTPDFPDCSAIDEGR